MKKSLILLVLVIAILPAYAQREKSDLDFSKTKKELQAAKKELERQRNFLLILCQKLEDEIGEMPEDGNGDTKGENGNIYGDNQNDADTALAQVDNPIDTAEMEKNEHEKFLEYLHEILGDAEKYDELSKVYGRCKNDNSIDAELRDAILDYPKAVKELNRLVSIVKKSFPDKKGGAEKAKKDINDYFEMMSERFYVEKIDFIGKMLDQYIDAFAYKKDKTCKDIELWCKKALDATKDLK